MELDDKVLIDKYLHGELSDPEQESLEERFFVVDDFYEQIETAEMRLIDRFVRGEMDSAEVARFEAGYITSPERQKKVAKESLFHKELGRLKRERKGWLSGVSSLFEIRMPVLQFASVAAILLICVGVFWTVLVFQSSLADVAVVDPNGIEPPVNTVPQNPPPVSPEPVNNKVQDKQEKEAPAPAPGSSPAPQPTLPNIRIQPGPGPIVTNRLEGIVSATLEPGASGRAPGTVAVKLSQKTVFLSLNLALPAAIKGESFSVSVSDNAGKSIASLRAVTPRQSNSGRVLSLNLPAGNFKKGLHVVSVRTEVPDSKTLLYPIRIERRD